MQGGPVLQYAAFIGKYARLRAVAAGAASGNVMFGGALNSFHVDDRIPDEIDKRAAN